MRETSTRQSVVRRQRRKLLTGSVDGSSHLLLEQRWKHKSIRKLRIFEVFRGFQVQQLLHNYFPSVETPT